MERTITGTVGEVKGRTVNTKYGEKTVYDVQVGTEKTSTFKANIAEEARALQGSTVDATVREEQRGDYTNYMLLGVKLVDAYPAAAQTTSNGVGTVKYTGNASSTIPVTTAPEKKKGWQPEDTARVTRLSCLSTAFQYAGATGSSEGYALDLAERLYGVAMGKQQTLDEAIQEVGLEDAVEPATVSDGVPW